MTIFSLPIVPGLSPAPTLQRYAYTPGSTTVGAAVGSAVTGVVDGVYSHVWNFDVSAWAVGDYWVLLSGASTPNALPWPCRVTATEATYYPTIADLNLDASGSAVTGVVTATGTIPGPIIIGDDYLASIGRSFQWTIAALTGFNASTSVCQFGGAYKGNAWLVTGTVASVGGGNWTLTFDLPRTATEGLAEGYYEWSVEVANASGSEFTRVRSGRNVLLVDKQT
jgi:hypothetical protein